LANPFSGLEEPVALVCDGDVILRPELFGPLRRVNGTLLKDFGPIFNFYEFAPLLAPRFRGDKFTPAKAWARKQGGGFNAGLEHLTAMIHKKTHRFVE